MGGEPILQRVQFGHQPLYARQADQREIAVIAQLLQPLDDPPEIVRLATRRGDQQAAIAIVTDAEIGPHAHARTHVARYQVRVFEAHFGEQRLCLCLARFDEDPGRAQDRSGPRAEPFGQRRHRVLPFARANQGDGGRFRVAFPQNGQVAREMEHRVAAFLFD